MLHTGSTPLLVLGSSGVGEHWWVLSSEGWARQEAQSQTTPWVTISSGTE